MVIHRRTGWTGHIAPRTLLAVLFVVSLAATGCSSDDELGAGDAATVGRGSVAEYAIDGGTWTTREAGEVIPAGAQVRATGKQLRLTFREGSVRLSADAVATLAADRVTLERGEALIDSDGGLGATLDDTTLDGAAQYRVTSGLAARVGVYRGEVAVARPAQQRTVRALRELDISDFRLAATPRPLQYREADAWDQELLATAIAFDGEAARLSRGLDLELGTRPQPASFYRQFAPARVVSVLSNAVSADRIGPPSDVLLTVFVARAAGSGAPASVRRVAGLRSDGARWGLIATELDVASERVVAAIDGLGSRSLALADATPADRSSSLSLGGSDLGTGGGADLGTGTAGGTGGTTGGTTGSGGGGTGGTGGGTGGEDPPSTPPGGGGGEEPEPPPPPPPEDPVQRVVDDVVDGIAASPDGEDAEGGVAVPSLLDPVTDLLDN